MKIYANLARIWAMLSLSVLQASEASDSSVFVFVSPIEFKVSLCVIPQTDYVSGSTAICIPLLLLEAFLCSCGVWGKRAILIF